MEEGNRRRPPFLFSFTVILMSWNSLGLWMPFITISYQLPPSWLKLLSSSFLKKKRNTGCRLATVFALEPGNISFSISLPVVAISVSPAVTPAAAPPLTLRFPTMLPTP